MFDGQKHSGQNVPGWRMDKIALNLSLDILCPGLPISHTFSFLASQY